VSSSEPRDRRFAEFESHEASGFPQKEKLLLFLTENRQFHKFIILTMILPLSHDSAIYWGKIQEYFVKLAAMLHKHGMWKWNYDIFVTSSRSPTREV